MSESPTEHVGALLLDSSLISATQYDYKIIQCGDYFQVYKFTGTKTRKEQNEEKKQKLAKILKSIDTDNLYKKENLDSSADVKKVEYKNIMRSKFQLQRLVKANENSFKTFITLTFSDNITDISIANKKFATWRTKINSIFKDFQYVCVPEYQKKREKKYGYSVVHYHLLTNIEIDKIYPYIRRNKQLETQLIIPQKEFTEKQLKNMSTEQRKRCYDVKYWSYGYSSVYPLNDINVVGYITKYMTKDVDDRLWGKRKYLNSHNLIQPKTVYIDSERQKEYEKIFILENLYDIKFKNIYYDLFGNEIEFTEYKY